MVMSNAIWPAAAMVGLGQLEPGLSSARMTTESVSTMNWW